ncbi:hypothetical protein [Paracoccus sp. ME4]|uniref:hypothetical protein n=1 Tax=Paracoccus sp. ME4 TaxID=3138066 RepID=UPI00398B62C8
MFAALIIRQIVKSALVNSASEKALSYGSEAVADKPAPRVKPNFFKRTAQMLGAAGIATVVALATVQAVTTVLDVGYNATATRMTHLDAAAPVSQSDLRALGNEYADLFRMGGRQFSAGMAAASPFSGLDGLREDRNSGNGSFYDAGAAFQRKNNLFKEEIVALSERFEQADEEFSRFRASNVKDAEVALLAGALIAFEGHSDAIDGRILTAVDEWKQGGAARSAHAERMGRFIRTEMALNPVLLAQTAALLDEYRPVLDANETRSLGRHVETLPEAQRERAIELMGSPYLRLDDIEELIPGRDALTRALEGAAPQI